MTPAQDKSDFTHFLAAQAPVYATVCRELADGQKRSHWIWYIFPQLQGLGMSIMSQRFALASLAEAKAYLAEPVLGARLHQCTQLILARQDRSARAILGTPDDMKFQSSMTLFAAASEKGSPFERALHQFFDGEKDEQTLALLGI